MKKILFFISVALFATSMLQAQDDELPPPSSKPRLQQFPGSTDNAYANPRKAKLAKYLIEPNVNFMIAQGGLNLGVSPYLGYNVWKGLCVGGGVTYIYTRYHNVGLVDGVGNVYYANANWHSYGGGVYVQYNIWKGFFARTRFELLHREIEDIGNATVDVNPQTNATTLILPKVKTNMPALLVGVGYNVMVGRGFFLPVMVSYNVLYPATDKRFSLYPGGWAFQLGFVNTF